MNPSRRLAYLRALDVPVWIPKEQAVAPAVSDPACRPERGGAPPGLSLSAGESGLLVVCNAQEEPAGRLARDIARALREEPVWAWPEPAGEGVTITAAVDDRLFTGVLVLGAALAERLFGGAPSERVGSARLVVADDLAALATDPPARRRLWGRLCREGLVRTR